MPKPPVQINEKLYHEVKAILAQLSYEELLEVASGFLAASSDGPVMARHILDTANQLRSRFAPARPLD